MEALPTEWKSKFDMVMVYDVLHDLPHPKVSVQEIYKVLSEKGVVIFVDPGIHSKHRDEIGNPVAGLALGVSMCVCLPSSMSNGGEGVGIGWGIENKRKLLDECNLKIVSEQKIRDNLFEYAMFCQKK